MRCVASLSSSWLAQQGLSEASAGGQAANGVSGENGAITGVNGTSGGTSTSASAAHDVFAETLHASMQSCVAQLRLACRCTQQQPGPDGASLLATTTAHALVALTHAAVGSHTKLSPKVLQVWTPAAPPLSVPKNIWDHPIQPLLNVCGVYRGKRSAFPSVLSLMAGTGPLFCAAWPSMLCRQHLHGHGDAVSLSALTVLGCADVRA